MSSSYKYGRDAITVRCSHGVRNPALTSLYRWSSTQSWLPLRRLILPSRGLVTPRQLSIKATDTHSTES
jgi:hypothetical protein